MPRDTDQTPPPYAHSEGEWVYTQQESPIVQERKRLERQSGARERHTIGRDARIDSGVYEGEYGGEAIVVDREKYPFGYEQARTAILEAASTRRGEIDKDRILGATYKYVSKHMRYDAAAVAEMFEKDCRGVDHQKIALEAYIQRGIGVCRHQALFTGMILEGFTDDGILGGRASVDRNMLLSDRDDKYDGHAWVRYTNSVGRVYIIDVAQQKLDSLDRLAAARARGKNVWDYERPEDKSKKLGGKAVRYVAKLPTVKR